MPFLGSGIGVTDFKNLLIENFNGTVAPNINGSYPIKLENGVGFKTNASSSLFNSSSTYTCGISSYSSRKLT